MFELFIYCGVLVDYFLGVIFDGLVVVFFECDFVGFDFSVVGFGGVGYEVFVFVVYGFSCGIEG